MTKPLAVIIEDDPHLSDIIKITLEAEFETENYSDGVTGWERLMQTVPDIVVLDLNLPGLQGKDILDRIRENEKFTNTRVILTTADEQQAEYLRDKADITLLKPVSPGQLRKLASRLKPS